MEAFVVSYEIFPSARPHSIWTWFQGNTKLRAADYRGLCCVICIARPAIPPAVLCFPCGWHYISVAFLCYAFIAGYGLPTSKRTIPCLVAKNSVTKFGAQRNNRREVRLVTGASGDGMSVTQQEGRDQKNVVSLVEAELKKNGGKGTAEVDVN